MPQDPFPSPGVDGGEPDGPEPDGPEPPGSGDRWPGDDPDAGAGAEQGLFVCLPAEDLDVARFAQHGQSDAMQPGPLLASVVDALTGDDGKGLAALSDDQLVGIIAATRRLESRIAWTQLAAIAEFAARRPANPAGRDGGGPGPGSRPGGPVGEAACEFAADELAAELRLTWQSAAGHIAYACAVAGRLPRTLAALAAGVIHPVHARIIEDETSILTAEDAARADEALAEAAASRTFGQLRSHAHRLVLKLDPDAARKRKEAAGREAHVRRFREGSGNAGMVARELPPDEVLASWQHVEQRALDLRAAGVPGTLRELRVRAYLDLLQERDSRTAPATPGTAPGAVPDGPLDHSSPGGPPDGTGGSAPGGGPGAGGGPGSGPQPDSPGGGPGSGPQPDSPGGGPGSGPQPDSPGGGPGSGPEPDSPAVLAGTGPDTRAGKDPGPAVAALVTITVPWSTLAGQSDMPGEAAGLGLLDADSARDLVTAAARHPHTRWCLTTTAPDGTAVAHGCAAGQLPWRAGPQAAGFFQALRLTLLPVIRGPCAHAQAERRYRPGPKLRHLVNARNTRCTAPGCGQPAARCDLDHTTPWHHDGPTCPCNLAPLCRHHHRCKQAGGWWLEQPEPGVLVWRTPSGRTYATTPAVYPV